MSGWCALCKEGRNMEILDYDGDKWTLRIQLCDKCKKFLKTIGEEINEIVENWFTFEEDNKGKKVNNV